MVYLGRDGWMVCGINHDSTTSVGSKTQAAMSSCTCRSDATHDTPGMVTRREARYEWRSLISRKRAER